MLRDESTQREPAPFHHYAGGQRLVGAQDRPRTGRAPRDRGIAGELLLRRAERLRGTRKDLLLGNIAGFQIFVADIPDAVEKVTY